MGKSKPVEYLTVPQAAELLGRPVATVRRWCSEGTIPGAVRFGMRAFAIPRQSVEKFVEPTLGRKPIKKKKVTSDSKTGAKK
jgi:excisionase family DNA binding protein